MIRLYLLLLLAGATSWSWDYEGHRLVNEFALKALGTNAPAFIDNPEARERIAFLAGEPDRWRNNPDSDLGFKHASGPDHFFDADALPPYNLQPEALPHFRYDFLQKCVLARAAAPSNFPAIDPARDKDHTKSLVGFLPWTIAEYYGKLKAGWSYLRALENGGTPEEAANARQNIIYVMGVMGHFVGDASQPLHSTLHYNGWVGDNTNKYTTARTFHAWIDGGYLQRLGVRLPDFEGQARPAKLLWDTEGKHPDVFPEALSFIMEQHKLVRTLYDLEKEKKLAKKEDGPGRDLLLQQLARGGQFLADLWFSAMREAAPDEFLANQLARRKKSP